MKIIHIDRIKPHYDFPEWIKELKNGYIFYLDDWEDTYNYMEIVFRIGKYVVCKRVN